MNVNFLELFKLCKEPSVFCPGFQNGRVPSEKGTFSAVNGLSKGRGERKKKAQLTK